MKEQAEKDEAVINDILSGAKCLFARHGLKKTTMEEIAQAAGKGKSSLYYYFPSKSELFEAVVEAEMKSLIKNLRSAINKATTAKEKLKAFGNAHLDAIMNCQNLDKVLHDGVFDNIRTLCNIRQKYEQTQIKMIKEIIIGGIQEGHFKDLADEAINKFSFLIITAFRGLHFPLSIKPANLDSEKYLDEMADLLIEGIGKS